MYSWFLRLSQVFGRFRRILPRPVPSVLITAFEPYDRWQENSSWLALVALTRNLPTSPKIVTRRYPVDFEKTKALLAKDLEANFDYALHLGQSPSLARIHLEAVGINVGGHSRQLPDEFGTLTTDGPAAYRSSLPLDSWAAKLREAEIPARRQALQLPSTTGRTPM